MIEEFGLSLENIFGIFLKFNFSLELSQELSLGRFYWDLIGLSLGNIFGSFFVLNFSFQIRTSARVSGHLIEVLIIDCLLLE